LKAAKSFYVKRPYFLLKGFHLYQLLNNAMARLKTDLEFSFALNGVFNTLGGNVEKVKRNNDGK
jgi:hypothetical protein